MTDLKKVLAANMKLYRKSLDISQEKLAEMVNISDNYVALIETGKRFPSVKMLERIAKALQKDTVELFSIKYIEQSKKKALRTAILADIEHILAVRLNETE
jgi:transcriptional regulator with XRE-family HTH domain